MDKSNKIVLIVEDDEVLLRALYLQLKNSGYSLSSATDGDTAISVAQKIKPDIILLDLILPKKDGFEVLRILKSDQTLKDIPVLVLSNLGSDADIKRAKDLGAIDYFVKSSTKLEDINNKINNYLG